MRRLIPLVFVVLPAILMRDVSGSALPGAPFGEGWGRLYMAGQLGRWLRSEAPWGVPDLCATAEPVHLWPVDLLTTAFLWALSPLGDGPALAGTLVVLLSFAGVATWFAARTFGASEIGATAAGAGLQIHPFLLRNATDGVLEAVAVGGMALSLATAARALGAPTAGRLAHLGAAVWVLGATNPYGAVYAALVAALCAPWCWWRFGSKALLRVCAAAGVALALAAAPIVATEDRPGGRLDPAVAAKGYTPTPGPPKFVVDGALRDAPPPALRGPVARPPSAAPAPQALPDAIAWLLRLPGGVATWIGLVLALPSRRARPFLLFAVVAFAAGPGLPRTVALFAPRLSFDGDLIQAALSSLPFTQTLGNPQRALLLFIQPAWIAIALAGGAWRVLLLALLEAWTATSGLRLPVFNAPADPAVLAAASGVTSTFPVGDPPIFHDRVPPKFSLWLATHHQQPVPSDYGRYGAPLDLGLQLALSERAGMAVRGAITEIPPVDDSAIDTVLVLWDFVPPQGREPVHAWLTARYGPPTADSAWGATWDVSPVE